MSEVILPIFIRFYIFPFELILATTRPCNTYQRRTSSRRQTQTHLLVPVPNTLCNDESMTQRRSPPRSSLLITSDGPGPERLPRG